jgi:hypothetical protein
LIVSQKLSDNGVSGSQRGRSQTAKDVVSSLRRHGTISPSTSETEHWKTALSNTRDVNPRSNLLPIYPTHGRKTQPQVVVHGQRQYKASTPVEKALPPSPFHATRSGSTISSIKSHPTLQFEALLESCEPSLLHIAPKLRRLGIRRVEHLRAIAKLTPKTRDREVKEDAFRLGITVMDWAIFLDKIFTL